MIKKVKITEVIANPNNPRLIKDEKFKKLVKSIQDFPDMLKVRPIVVNKDMVVLGGNMRLKAIKEAGHTEVAVEIVDWNEQQQKEFIVKDNVGYGEWDWDDLANNWDAQELTDWGLDVPNFNTEGFADKNKELSLDDVIDSMTITLKYTEDEYHIVKDALLKLASTPEQAVWKLLGND
jgi:ParB-like chromosome segregation protein Spo0J